jgi:hypothetical protein
MLREPLGDVSAAVRTGAAAGPLGGPSELGKPGYASGSLAMASASRKR